MTGNSAHIKVVMAFTDYQFSIGEDCFNRIHEDDEDPATAETVVMVVNQKIRNILELMTAGDDLIVTIEVRPTAKDGSSPS